MKSNVNPKHQDTNKRIDVRRGHHAGQPPPRPAAQRLLVRATDRPAEKPPPSPERPRRPSRAAARRRMPGCVWIFLALAVIAFLAAALLYGMGLYRSPINLLVLGIDRRQGEGDGVRADTILLVHADPADRRFVLLSIPRDLWVEIPNWGEARINSAHVYGELEEPGSGPARTMQTITHNFGVSVDHYLRMDFDAFREVIAAAGGVDIDVPKPVIDNAYPTEDYGTIRIEIPAGYQHMDAETALRYARSRHGSSDFDRAARQQQIVVALVKKLSTPKGWLLIPRVYRAFQAAVETDLQFRDLAALGLAWYRSGDNELEKAVIDQDMTTPYRTADGASVLLPRWELIKPLIQQQFAR